MSSIRFDRITVEDGLSSGDIWSIYQDRYGFMWFGTSNGLNRYDGRNIKVYRNIPGDTTSLFADKVSAMVEDPSGNLWLLAGALHRYDRNQDRFVRYQQGLLSQISVSLNFGPDLKCDASGVLWIGTRKGLVTFDTQRDKLQHIDLSIGNTFPSMMSFDHQGFLWIPYMHPSMIIRLDTATLSYKVFLNEQGRSEDLVPPGQTLGVYADRQNNIWMYTWGLVKIDQKEIPIYLDTLLADGTRISTTGICEDSLGRLWTGSLRGGIRMYDPLTGSIHLFKHQSSNPASPNSDEVRVTYTDRVGNVWFGTTRGVAKFPRFAKPFRHYRNYTNDDNVILPGEIKGLWEDRKGNLWSTHWGEGVSKSNLKDGHVRNYNSLEIVNWVFDVYEDRNGTLLVSVGLGGRIARYNRQKDRFDEFQLFPSTALDRRNVVLQMLQEPLSGIFWYATLNGIVREEDGRRTWYDGPTNAGLPTTEFTRLFLDSRQILWTETVGGDVFYYDRTKSVFRQVDGIRSFCYSFFEDRDGYLWLGTAGGINKYDHQKDSIILRVRVGLNNGDYVYGILGDDNDNLWLATTNGIVRYNTLSDAIRMFGPSDGIPLPTIGVPTKESYKPYCKLSTGELAMGLGAEGFVVFHPDSIKDNPNVPPVYITNILVDNKEIDNVRDLATKNLHTRELILSYDQNDFSIQYASLDYTAPMNNLYMYKLEGYEREWINAGNRNIVYYTNIDPGEYVFRVKGSNNDGVWNEEGASIVIIITPPWWQTWWAYISYSTLFIGLLIGLRRYELNRQGLKHKAELEHMEAQQLKELDHAKSRFFANISHEFRTPLTLIEGPASQILEETEEEPVKSKSRIIVRNARRLLQLVNQLLDLSKIEARKMTLQVAETPLAEFLRRIAAAFESLAVRRDIEFEVMVADEVGSGWVDRDAVEKIVSNLLSNAFKFTPEGGEIRLEVSAGDGWAEFRVQDTGIGLAEEQLDKVFDRFYQVETGMATEGTGIGLALVKELVQLHRGRVAVESVPGKGTTFTVRIPVRKEAYRAEEIVERPYTPVGTEVDTVAPEVSPAGETDARGPRVLVIEDNADMRAHIRSYVQEQFTLEEAVDGREGLEKAMSMVPDLILSDVMMPYMDGFELCRRLKSDDRTSHIPVILLTAKAGQEHKLEGLETGADDYLAKPFDGRELLVRIQNLIRVRETLRRSFQKALTVRPGSVQVSSMDEKFLKRVFACVEAHLADVDFDSSRLADEVAMSRMNLHRKIKALTGYSTGELIRHFRLERAAELLSKNAGTVSEIAYDVGFTHLSHFARMFREKFGHNPSEHADRNT
jgi:signal transduction histidine kinase/CheY-like chemotaxis protein/ligand-binding sensor domain-containing protein